MVYLQNADQPAQWFVIDDHNLLVYHANGWVDKFEFNTDLTSYKAANAKLQPADWGGGSKAQ
jgi:hypothetical protein